MGYDSYEFIISHHTTLSQYDEYNFHTTSSTFGDTSINMHLWHCDSPSLQEGLNWKEVHWAQDWHIHALKVLLQGKVKLSDEGGRGCIEV